MSLENFRFESGQHLSHCRLIRRIGAGGIGEVYLAEDAKLERKVAFKLLPDTMAAVYQSVVQVNRTFSGSIKATPLTGSGPPLTVEPDGFSLVWSKNGEWSAFFRRSNDDFEIWCARPTGDEARKVASGGVEPPEYIDPAAADSTQFQWTAACESPLVECDGECLRTYNGVGSPTPFGNTNSRANNSNTGNSNTNSNRNTNSNTNANSNSNRPS
jgi:hypothetical protein